MKFKLQLDNKFVSLFSDVMKAKKRYETGLEKLQSAQSQVTIALNFASCNVNILMSDLLVICQVSAMQAELEALQPQLIQAGKEVDEIMVIIEKDSVEVAKKEKVKQQLMLLKDTSKKSRTLLTFSKRVPINHFIII